MQQPALFNPPSLSVSALTHYLRQVLESDDLLRDVWVLGEISNLSRPGSGHIYFTLKDQNAALRCVIWRTAAQRLRGDFSNGLAVEAHGHLSLYERDGQYQLYVDALRPAGEGWLYQEFLRLKARLEAEGLFDEERKRSIPVRPERIGIVTSPTGAALQDMLNTLDHRYPLVEVILAPAAVQGEDAPSALVAALQQLNRLSPAPDVILLARGGGSLEDLWAFNDERVVRAIVASRTPVITGIGHETDYTLSDFAADLRAPTPTGAAVLAVPDATDLRSTLLEWIARLDGMIGVALTDRRLNLQERRSELLHLSPQRVVQNDRQLLDAFSDRANRAITSASRLRRTHLEGMHSRIQALNPLAVLQRGYALVQSPDGRLVRSVEQLHPAQEIAIRLADGSIQAQVNTIYPLE